MDSLHEYHILNENSYPFILREAVELPLRQYVANWHENIEILCFIQGSGTVVSDLTEVKVKEGDIFVVNSCSIHRVDCENDGLIYHCLIADRDFCLQNGIPTGTLVFKPLVNDDFIYNTFKKITHELKETKPFSKTALNVYVLEILLKLARDHLETHPPSGRKNNLSFEGVKAGIAYINSHFREKITLNALAKEAAMNRYSFSREFTRITGKTVVSYINHVRCGNAFKLLQTGKYSAGEAALICGYENFSYFSKTYKKIIGISPSKTFINYENII